MADNKLERVDSFQYPAAHVGHLSASQASSLDTFKKLCQENKYYIPASKTQAPSHDDETLLRYLRARKFVPSDAWVQFKDTEDWRKQQAIEELYDTIDIEAYDETRLLYPQWTGRRDKRGIPVYVFEVAGLDSKTMSAYEASAGKSKEPGRLAPKLLRLFALYENLTQFVLPLCSVIPNRPHPETPISQSNNIVDISRVGLKQFWNLKGHMQDASQLATAHYPETLDRIFIIGAPSFFPTVWNWIKRWFDPITVSKIFILGQNEVEETLSRFIEPENIPKKYGGQLEWSWGSLPAIEPAIVNALMWADQQDHSLPVGPIKWRSTTDGNRLEAVAVGSQEGKKREQVLASIPVRENSTTTPTALNSTQAQATESVGHHDNQQTKPAEVNERHDQLSQDNAQTRTGTSETKYAQQSHTLANGQLETTTPGSRDNGQGDKTATTEPGTVGQASKAVEVPEAQPSTGQSSTTYVEQAKAAVGAVAGMASGVSTSVIAAAGLGSKGKAEADEAEKGSTVEGKKETDPQVDAMKQQEVENFIRSRYETSAEMGANKT